MKTEHSLSSVDLRDILRVSPQAMNDIYAKLKIRFLDDPSLPARGRVKQIPRLEVRRVLESRGFKFNDGCRVFSFMMCKGGVGKTTSSFFLAQRLSSFGFKVLAVDTDTQGSLTSAFDLDRLGFEVDPETPVVADIISKRCSVSDALIEVSESLSLIPSTPLNANLDAQIRDGFKNYSLAFKGLIGPMRNKFDIIVIDCAPALNLTNTAAVCASDCVVMPVAPDKFSQIGLEQTIQEINQIEEDFCIRVEKKILFTKYDAREFLSFKYLAEIVEKHDKSRLRTAIRTCTDAKNVLTKHEDLFSLRRSNARADYDSLAQELSGLAQFSARRKAKKKAA